MGSPARSVPQGTSEISVVLVSEGAHAVAATATQSPVMQHQEVVFAVDTTQWGSIVRGVRTVSMATPHEELQKTASLVHAHMRYLQTSSPQRASWTLTTSQRATHVLQSIRDATVNNVLLVTVAILFNLAGVASPPEAVVGSR